MMANGQLKTFLLSNSEMMSLLLLSFIFTFISLSQLYPFLIIYISVKLKRNDVAYNS